MARIESWFKQDLKKPVQVQAITGNIFSQDDQGNLIGVEVFDNGEPATLSGTVSANIIRADGATVAATGTLSGGNKVSVVLPAAAYAVPGNIVVALKLTTSGVITTLLALVVTVYRTTTDTTVDPGTIIPSIQDLIDEIETAVDSIPADYSSLWTSLAPAFSASTAYAIGDYVTYNGKLYRFTTAHAAGTWDSAHVAQTNLGAEDSALKSAIDNKEIVNNEKTGRMQNGLSSFIASLPSVSKQTQANYIPNGSVTNILYHGADAGLFDGMTVIDGENIKVTALNGQTTAANIFIIGSVSDKANGANNFIADRLPLVPPSGYEGMNGRAANNNVELKLLKTRCEYTIDSANEYLKKHPIRIWYETINKASATEFYYVVSSFNQSYYSQAVGTLEPISALLENEYIDFGRGKVVRTGDTETSVQVSGMVSSFDPSYTVGMNSTNTIKISVYTCILPAFVAYRTAFDIDGKYIQQNGGVNSNADYKATQFIPFTEKDKFYLQGFNNGSSSLACAFYDESKTYISNSGINNLIGNLSSDDITIPSTTKFVKFSTNFTNAPQACIFLNNVHALANYEAKIEDIMADVDGKISEATPDNSSFFTRDNWFNSDATTIYTDRFVQADGKIQDGTNTVSMVFPVKPNTSYYLSIPNSNRGMVGESASDEFAPGTYVTNIYASGIANPIPFTTGATAKYVLVYFYSGTYDWNTYKDQIILNVGQYTGSANKDPYIDEQYMPPNAGTPLADTEILIFGDSITDTCNFTINSDKETTAMTWKDPSNSYVDAGGNTIRYSMWPKILKVNQPCKEVRNYARSGASYKTSSRTAGEERQNLQYQIDVALNDLDNPHNVFTVNNFDPNIVIFALGTNDGEPNDTYDSAMAKTVYKNDGVSIDVAATIANLDESKFCEAVRKAYMRVKQVFPVALIFVVLPIQRANNDVNLGTLHTYLEQMAQRYGAIIINGTADSGITRDFNDWNALGTYLKDGLHPNEKGQNMMARMIISSLMAHYIPFGTGFNN